MDSEFDGVEFDYMPPRRRVNGERVPDVHFAVYIPPEYRSLLRELLTVGKSVGLPTAAIYDAYNAVVAGRLPRSGPVLYAALLVAAEKYSHHSRRVLASMCDAACSRYIPSVRRAFSRVAPPRPERARRLLEEVAGESFPPEVLAEAAKLLDCMPKGFAGGKSTRYLAAAALAAALAARGIPSAVRLSAALFHVRPARLQRYVSILLAGCEE